MKFVLGKPHKGANPDWYMVLSTRTIGYRKTEPTVKTPSAEKVAQLWLKHVCTPIVRDWGHTVDNMTEYRIRAQTFVELPFLLVQRDGWYVNRVGGMSPNLLDIENEIEANDYPPSPMAQQEKFDGAKYSQWGAGEHWYVKLPDGTDVEMDGKFRFDSREKAVAATKQFLGL